MSVNANNTLDWDSVTTNSDNTPINNLSGYEVLIGNKSGVYSTIQNVLLTSTPATPEVTLGFLNLSNGRWYIVVRAYNTAGTKSALSNEVVLDYFTPTGGSASGQAGYGVRFIASRRGR